MVSGRYLQHQLHLKFPFKIFILKKHHFSIQKFLYRMFEHKRKTFHYYKFNPTLLSNFQHIHGKTGRGREKISNQNPEKIIKKLFRRLFTEAYNSNNIPRPIRTKFQEFHHNATTLKFLFRTAPRLYSSFFIIIFSPFFQF